MNERQEIRLTDRWFVISVFLKGVISAFEMLVGILVLVIPPQAVVGFLIDMSEDALSDNPDNFFAVHSLHALQHLPPLAQGFIAVYLFSRGFLKLLLVVALLRNQLWAYPAAIGVLGLFVCYQVYEVVKHHSPVVLLLSIFDLIVMWFIWREYRIVRTHPRHSAVEEVEKEIAA